MSKNGLIDASSMRSIGEALTHALGITVTFEPGVDTSARADTLLKRFAPPGTYQGPRSGIWRGGAAGHADVHSVEQAITSRSRHDSCTTTAEVPMRAAGQLLGTWYVQGPPVDVTSGMISRGAAAGIPYARETDPGGSCAVLECPPRTGHESAVALVTQVAGLIADTITERERMLDAAAYHSELALRKAVALCVLERIVDSVSIGLVEVDRGGEIGWTNRYARQLLGMSAHPSEEHLMSAPVCAVASIDGVVPSEAYTHIVRQLARGRVVRGVRCVLMREDGTSFAVNVDASPDLSENRRIDRVVISLHPPYEESSYSGDMRPSWEEVRALLSIVNTRAVSKRAEIAGQIQRGIGDALQNAWLEFDALRQDLDKLDEPPLSGRLETIALFLREATANAADLGAACRPQVWDHHGVVSALESRLSHFETTAGLDWSFQDRSNGKHSLDAARCTVLFQVGDELIARAADDSCRMEVALDANEHYWLLMVSSYGEEASACRPSDCSVDARVREALRSLSGSIETVRLGERHVVRYVILPTSAQ